MIGLYIKNLPYQQQTYTNQSQSAQLSHNSRKEVTNSVRTGRVICQVGKPIHELHELLGYTFSGSIPPR